MSGGAPPGTKSKRAKPRVAELYEGWLLARDAERFFDETEHWLERTIEDTQLASVSDSELTEQDVLRLQAGMSALRLASSQARTGRRQAEAGLAAYLALPSGAGLTPKEESLELLASALPDAASLVALALERRPELRALSSASLAYHSLAAAEAAGNFPDIFAYASVTGAYTPGRDLVETRYVTDPLYGFHPALLLGARWHVTGTMASGRADEQRAMASELEHQRRWAILGLTAEVTKAFEDVQRAKADAEQAEKGIQIAKEWLVRASADFSIGLGSSADVGDASQAYVQLRVASFDARYRHNVALAELARTTGTLGDSAQGFYPTRKE
jgi:outer membrane protein TolC